MTDRAQQSEQQRLATLSQVLKWLEVSSSCYDIAGAYVFGSLIRPYRFTPRSDVDIAVTTINPTHFFAAMAALSEWVQRPVDLVELAKCPFAERVCQQGLLWMPPPSPS
ncbi:MAG: nucleotidyltransferase family protein [Leptolyngbyaceae cyanobacterium]